MVRLRERKAIAGQKREIFHPYNKLVWVQKVKQEMRDPHTQGVGRTLPRGSWCKENCRDTEEIRRFENVGARVMLATPAAVMFLVAIQEWKGQGQGTDDCGTDECGTDDCGTDDCGTDACATRRGKEKVYEDVMP